MSKKEITLSKDQLDFIMFMHENTASYPDLRARVIKCEEKSYQYVKHDRKEIKRHHSPKTMIEFLSLFSKDDRFKWFTHKWDMSVEFKIDDMITRLNANKSILSKMAYGTGDSINERSYNQVWNFINFENSNYPWRNNDSKAIHYGWHSIVELSRNNPSIPVENIKLDDGHLFKYYIDMFKSSIEFRTDLDDKDRFSELVHDRIKKGLKEFKLIFKIGSEDYALDEIGYDLNTYCDVPGFLYAIEQICNWITKYKTNGSEVSIDLTANKESYDLVIMHHNSYFSNKSKLENPSGDFETLRNRLFSVCDLKMEGDYKCDGINVGSLLVNALDNNTIMSEDKISPCHITSSDKIIGGVKYTLTIYKKV